MTDYFSVVRRLGLIILLNFYLISFLVYVVRAHRDWLGQIFPGRFGPNFSVEFTGNYFVATLFVVLTGILIVLTSFYSLFHRLRDSWSEQVVSLSSRDRTIERKRFRSLIRFFLLGAILLGIGFCLSSYCFARASPRQWPLFQDEREMLPNEAVTFGNTTAFTVDQFFAGVTFGLSERSTLRVTRLTVNPGNRVFNAFTSVFRVIMLWIVVSTLLFVLGNWISAIRWR